MKLLNLERWRFERFERLLFVEALSSLVTFCNTCIFAPDCWLDSVINTNIFFQFCNQSYIKKYSH